MNEHEVNVEMSLQFQKRSTPLNWQNQNSRYTGVGFILIKGCNIGFIILKGWKLER